MVYLIYSLFGICCFSKCSMVMIGIIRGVLMSEYGIEVILITEFVSWTDIKRNGGMAVPGKVSASP